MQIFSDYIIYVIILISYMIGNISPSYIISKKIKKVDIRKLGSGNAGTTNTLRIMGKKIALLVFIIDFFKGFLTVFFVRKYFGIDYAVISMIAVVLGHIFPIVLGFKGGKGVATTLGVLYCLFTKEIFICSIIGIIILFITRYVSLAGLVTLFLVNLVMIFYKIPYFQIICTFIIFSVVSIKHKENIVRLINHTERKIGDKK